jgi:hypothetical protein
MHVRRTLALAAATPLLLAGCTGEAEPTPKMPDPTTSSPSPSPTESETAEAESPEEFIRRWSDALREMQRTGETQEFRSLSSDCQSCSETADRVEAIYKAGGAIEWEGWHVVSVEPNGDARNEFRVVERSAPTRFRESNQAKWQRLPGGRSTHVFELQPAGDSWLVVRAAEAAS